MAGTRTCSSALKVYTTRAACLPISRLRCAGPRRLGGVRVAAAASSWAAPPHSGYHFDGSDRRFFEGWYWKVWPSAGLPCPNGLSIRCSHTYFIQASSAYKCRASNRPCFVPHHHESARSRCPTVARALRSFFQWKTRETPAAACVAWAPRSWASTTATSVNSARTHPYFGGQRTAWSWGLASNHRGQ